MAEDNVETIKVTCRAADLLPIDALSEFQGELKKITKANISKLKKSILKHGFTAPIFVWKEYDNYILDGHQRLKALCDLRKDGYDIPLLPVAYIEAESEEDAKRKLLHITSQYGEFSLDGLQDFTEGLDFNFEEVRLTDGELDITSFEQDEEIVEDEAPEIPETPRTVNGDIYQLGNHRVMCGDSTLIDDVEKLMDGKKANMLFTDPPYLMGFTGNVHGDGSKSFNSKHGAIKNDKMSVEDGKKFVSKTIMSAFTVVDGAFYICFYRLGMHYIFNALLDNGLDYKAVIIWDKGNHTLSNSDYMSRYEPIIYGWFKEHKFYGGRSNFDIWSIDRTAKNDLHPTMKPIALCAKAINNSSEHNGIVLDLFLGSGSTLIACEQTNRICYGMELDEKYCDVIVQRWVNQTGGEVVLNGEKIEWESKGV